MKTRFYLISLLVAMLGFMGCNNNNPETTNPDNQTTNPDNQGEKSAIVVTPTEINAPKEGGEYTLEVKFDGQWSVSSNASWVTCNPGVGRNNGKIVVTVAESDITEITTGVLTIGEFGGSADSKVKVVITREAADPPLEINFSVSNNKKVNFSKGNLQYQASTNTWRFAENQYDIVGYDNKNISATYSGWIDLFCWGTGNNPTQSSQEDTDYRIFTDWGVNTISNADNTATQWRTLTKDEWEYLFSGRTNADNLRGPASVNYITGYIFLPDLWSLPSGLSFTSNANDWATNSYSVSDWQLMEKSGAVFLPAAGSRNGHSVDYVGSLSRYWSSSPHESRENDAWAFRFDDEDAQMRNSYRGNGQSVRLVQDVE